MWEMGYVWAMTANNVMWSKGGAVVIVMMQVGKDVGQFLPRPPSHHYSQFIIFCMEKALKCRFRKQQM